MFKKYDFVRVLGYPDEKNNDLDRLVGKEGMIIDVLEWADYPYEICFFDKEAQEISMRYGILLWNEKYIEDAKDKNVAGAKREIRRLRESLKYNKTVDGWKISEYLRRIERML